MTIRQVLQRAEGWKRICSLLGTALGREFRLPKRLIVVAINFEKAFDRVALIRVLMYYKCDP